MNLKKNGKVLTSKSVGTGPSSYEEGIYRTAVSQRLRNTGSGTYMKPLFLEGVPAVLAFDLKVRKQSQE